MKPGQRQLHFSYKDFFIPIILSAVVIASNFYNFLLFHTLAELFAITVAILMALVAWNMYLFTRNNFLLYLGTGYFWVGLLDLMHTLTYKGLSLFTVTGVNVGTQFWISTRYVEAFLLLSAPWFLSHAINRSISLYFYGALAVVIFIAIMMQVFPNTYIEGIGLTSFKINSEYAIIAMLTLAIVYLLRERSKIDGRVLYMMIASIVLTMFAELAFTFYMSIHDISNILGHVFKLFSYWLIFLAVIKTTLQEPFLVLSREASTYDAVPDAIVVLDKDGIIRQANTSAARLAKLSHDDLIGKNSAALFQTCVGEANSSCQNLPGHCIESKNCEREVEIGGERKWLSYSYSPIGSESGSRGRVEVIRDVTMRKRAEHQYERVNALKNSIIENLPLMLFVKDANELQYVEWNKKAEELTGVKKDEIFGKDDFAFWPTDEARFFQSKDREVIHEHKLLDIPQEQLSTKHGMRTLHTIKIPIYDEDSNPRYLLGISEDITERLQTDQALRQSQKMDAIGKLTGGIAHDFNNMLNVINGFSELLQLQAQDDEKVQGYVNEILKAGQRGMKLTNKLLAFTRSKSMDETIIDINRVLHEERHMLERTLTVRINLQYQLADGLWYVEVEGNDLEDAILNMAINAMHAMSGSGNFVITTENRQVDRRLASELDVGPGEYVRLTLQDDGIGMDEDTCAHVFDPFFSTKGELGTGLGLSQVYGFVRRSRGGIRVLSTPGKGARFELYFPRSFRDIPEKTEGANDADNRFQGKGSILVADDEAALRRLLEDLLSAAGYEVVVAENGRKALELLMDREFDLLLTDVLMPEMDGFQLVKQALQEMPELKVQFISGYSDNIDNQGIDAQLLNRTLQKPFSRDVLLERVQELLCTGASSKADSIGSTRKP